MEQTKTLPPLVSEQMRRLSSRMGNAEAYAIIQGFAADVEAIEADRQRTCEVVQALVDAAKSAHHQLQNILDYRLAEGSDRDKVRAEQDILRIAIALAKSQLQIEPTK